MDESAPLPPCGVIEVSSELIYYNSISDDGTTLLDCLRGYNNTTAAPVSAGAAGAYKSLSFIQDDCNPSFSYFLQTDHFWQAVTGATINAASLSLSNSGAVQFEFSTIQGMQVLLAGTNKVTSAAVAGDTVISVDLARSCTIGAWVWNKTMGDNNGGPAVGYKIVAVDDDAGTITLDAGIAESWPVDSIVTGFLPQNVARTGEPVKGVTSKVFIDGAPGKLRTTTLNYNNNITYLTDEIGTKFPEEYVEDARTITFEMNTYFRRQDAVRFKEGLEGKYTGVRFVFGEKNKVVLHMPKVQQEMPSPNMEPPTVSLNIAGTALPECKGNDAIYLIIN